MRRILCVGLALSITLFAAPASSQSVRAGDSTPPVPHVLFKGIALSKVQEDSLNAIRARYTPLYDSLRKQQNSDYAVQVVGLRERQRREMRKVLTTDQATIFDTNADAVRKEDRAYLKEDERRKKIRAAGGTP